MTIGLVVGAKNQGPRPQASATKLMTSRLFSFRLHLSLFSPPPHSLVCSLCICASSTTVKRHPTDPEGLQRNCTSCCRWKRSVTLCTSSSCQPFASVMSGAHMSAWKTKPSRQIFKGCNGTSLLTMKAWYPHSSQTKEALTINTRRPTFLLYFFPFPNWFQDGH
jgi:hypothetical protein